MKNFLENDPFNFTYMYDRWNEVVCTNEPQYIYNSYEYVILESFNLVYPDRQLSFWKYQEGIKTFTPIDYNYPIILGIYMSGNHHFFFLSDHMSEERCKLIKSGPLFESDIPGVLIEVPPTIEDSFSVGCCEGDDILWFTYGTFHQNASFKSKLEDLCAFLGKGISLEELKKLSEKITRE